MVISAIAVSTTLGTDLDPYPFCHFAYSTNNFMGGSYEVAQFA
jgi:hypothetical protein